ncbi:MAG: hypothetical protein AAB035_00410 [Nitrospirota bacterium]
MSKTVTHKTIVSGQPTTYNLELYYKEETGVNDLYLRVVDEFEK